MVSYTTLLIDCCILVSECFVDGMFQQLSDNVVDVADSAGRSHGDVVAMSTWSS